MKSRLKTCFLVAVVTIGIVATASLSAVAQPVLPGGRPSEAGPEDQAIPAETIEVQIEQIRGRVGGELKQTFADIEKVAGIDQSAKSRDGKAMSTSDKVFKRRIVELSHLQQDKPAPKRDQRSKRLTKRQLSKKKQKRDSFRINARQLRTAARMLDVHAADLEDDGDYAQADQVRATAQRLRLAARGNERGKNRGG